MFKNCEIGKKKKGWGRVVKGLCNKRGMKDSIYVFLKEKKRDNSNAFI